MFWMDTTKKEPTPIYVVDINKPPLPPPMRIFCCTVLGGEHETDLSKRQTEAWERYIKLYGETLKTAQFVAQC